MTQAVSFATVLLPDGGFLAGVRFARVLAPLVRGAGLSSAVRALAARAHGGAEAKLDSSLRGIDEFLVLSLPPSEALGFVGMSWSEGILYEFGEVSFLRVGMVGAREGVPRVSSLLGAGLRVLAQKRARATPGALVAWCDAQDASAVGMLGALPGLPSYEDSSSHAFLLDHLRAHCARSGPVPRLAVRVLDRAALLR